MSVQSRLRPTMAISSGRLGGSSFHRDSQEIWSPGRLSPGYEGRGSYIPHGDPDSPHSSGSLAEYRRNPRSSVPISVHSRTSGNNVLDPGSQHTCSHISISSDDSIDRSIELLRLENEVNKLKMQLARTQGRLDSSLYVFSFHL